ncbi:hypothetical protein [Fructobacillus americanaquae]|uniref:Phage protein n=1 Tax=Fructobacillus americanaquae TaxID=2940302 RepID=A0ABY5C2D3_9LACO|nr:hypothetical protein [Fructobacillus americanaquae]USS92008.1 hypothetical protein M3M36_06770 [Fructobacillus americanaquae]
MNNYVVSMSDFKGSVINPKGIKKVIIKANSKNEAIIKFIEQIQFEDIRWFEIKIKVEELGVIE